MQWDWLGYGSNVITLCVCTRFVDVEMYRDTTDRRHSVDTHTFYCIDSTLKTKITFTTLGPHFPYKQNEKTNVNKMKKTTVINWWFLFCPCKWYFQSVPTHYITKKKTKIKKGDEIILY